MSEHHWCTFFWEAHQISAELLYKALCYHIGCVNLVFCTSMRLFSSLVRLVREERGQAATTAASLKLSPSCFSDYQRCKLGNRSSARKGLYQLQSTHNSFPAPPHPACYLNRILVFAVLFSLLCEWVLLFTTHSCRMHSTYECVLGFVCLRDRSFQAFSAF